MSVIELISALTEKNIQIWLENDQLRFSAPKNALTDVLRDQVRAQKEEIIVFLQRNQTQSFTPITAAAPQQDLPLSFAQQRIWFLQQLDTSSQAFYIRSAFEIKGTLNIQTLQQAIQQLHQRHSILRTAYIQKNEGLFQQVIDDYAVNLTIENIAPSENEIDTETLLNKILEKQNIAFDLSLGQVTANNLYQIDEQHFIFCCCIHHIAADGWSMNILAEEILSLYANGNKTLAPLSIQYKDYASWQQDPSVQMEHQFSQQQAISYWQQQLSNMPALYINAKSRNRKLIDSQGASFKFTLDKKISLQLSELAAKEHVTLFSVLMSLFSALLYRYSEQTQFAIGTAVAGRSEAACEPLIGCFMNLLAIKNEHSTEQSFIQLLHANHTRLTQALEYQDVAFETVVKQLGLAGSTHTTPVFQTLFVLQNMPFHQSSQLSEINIAALPVNSHSAHYDLSLLANEWQGEIFAEFNYKKNLFNPDEIEVMAEAFQNLIISALATPDTSINQLNFLSSAEQQHLTNLSQGPSVSRNNNISLHQLIEEQALKTPNHCACIFSDQRLSYRQLNQQANQLAQHILTLNQQKPITVIAVSMQRSIQLPVILLAILKTGAAYLPLEPDFPTARARYMLQQSQCEILICDYAETCQFSTEIKLLIDLNMPQQWQTSSACENPNLAIQPQQLANIIYTSGSSGQPKGVMVSHQALLNRLQWMTETFPIDQSDRILQKTTASFDVSVWEIFWPLMQGACTVLATPSGEKDNHYLIELIQQEKITACHFVPSMLQLFLQTSQVEKCQSLKQVICSGETLSQELQDQFLQSLPATKLSNLYGPTEAAIDVSFHHCESHTASIIGKPISNTQLYIMNQQQHLLPQGVVGEIVIGGMGLAEGYIADQALSDKYFISNPLHQSDKHQSAKLYKTGDLGSYDRQGKLHFHGRMDSQVKVHGFRIELTEIECQLNTHPCITENIVVLTPDNQIAVFYLSNEVAQIEADFNEELTNFLSRHLPSYMLPQFFIAITEFPYTASGKRDLNKLMQSKFGQRYDRPIISPKTETEKMLYTLWTALLKQTNVSIHDNFFESGGHSILAINLQMKIEEIFSIRLSLSDLLNNPTIYVVAQKIDDLIMIQQGLQNLVIDDKDLGEDEEEISL